MTRAGAIQAGAGRARSSLLTSPLFSLQFPSSRGMKRHADRRSDMVARDLRDDPPAGRAAGEGRRSPEQRHQELWAVSHDDLQVADRREAGRRGGPQGAETSGAEARPDAATEAPGPSLDQWQGPAPVRLRLWPVDPADRGGADRAEV